MKANEKPGVGLKERAAAADSGLDGLLVVDKPVGLTSHDVVARVRRMAFTRRVGHTGTLDPMATGVLVLCLGKATRLIPYIEEAGGAAAKEYEAAIRFGFETTTDDAEGDPRGEPVSSAALDSASVTAALEAFVGEFEQIPPAFCAKKVAGERAYAIARRGGEVEMKASTVQVGMARLLGLDGEIARVRFACSRGTYIRSLARDLGRKLGVGGHLAALRRTRSGQASLDQAVPLGDLTPKNLFRFLKPMVSILPAWPLLSVGEGEVADLRLGRAVNAPLTPAAPAGRVRVCNAASSLVALAVCDGARLRPFCVF